MAIRNFGMELFPVLILPFLTAVIAGCGFGNLCITRQCTFYSSENRALQGFAYANKTAQSTVICGRECSMDEHCKSFNFNDCQKTCELNLAIRQEHPEAFSATQGSVYFDADEDTPLYSLDDDSSSNHGYRSCKMFLDAGYRSSGIYTIYPGGKCSPEVPVYCDMETDGGGWIVFQRRQDGSVDFYRNWAEYQSGFGNLFGEFWLGNNNLVTLTSNDSQGPWELRVDLGDWEGNKVWARYTNFKLSPGEYNLNSSLLYDQQSSTVPDSLSPTKGFPFSTMDNDNDIWEVDRNCAYTHKGGWWFKDCMSCHLNGLYYQKNQTVGADYGVYWWHWKAVPGYSLKNCSMKIREI